MTETAPISTTEEELPFSSLTTGTLDGTGLFDVLMHSVKQHLEEEFSQQRIRGAEYAKVYLGGLQATLGQAVQYLVNGALIDAQKRKLELEAKALEYELLLYPLKEKELDAKVRLIEAQVDAIERKTSLEVQKLAAEAGLIEAQQALAEYQVTNVQPKELEQIEENIKLIQAKTESEKLQPNILKAQEKLLITQEEGFNRDAEQKAAKIMADTYAVQKSVVEDLDPPDGLKAADITRVMVKLQEGIGAL